MLKSKFTVLGIVLYIFSYSLFNVFGQNIKTEILENVRYDFSINKQGLIIKEEHLITSNYKGFIEILVDENEKVKKNQTVAKVYESYDLENFSEKSNQLKNEINSLNNELNKDISDSSKKLIESQIKAKQNELEKINKKLDKFFEINSPISGKVCFSYDKNATIQNIDNITVDYIKNYEVKNEKIEFKKSKVKENDVVLKVINTSQFFVSFILDKYEQQNFKEGEQIYLKTNNKKITGVVYDIKKENDNYILVVKINTENSEILNSTSEKFDIIYDEVEGIRIKKSSTKLQNDKLGVYVVDFETNMPKFVELKGIEYEDDEYVYINYFKNKQENVKTVDIYDEIILNPNSLNVKIKIK